jgi:hypothetical protein
MEAHRLVIAFPIHLFAYQELPTHLELMLVPGAGVVVGYWLWSFFLRREHAGGPSWPKWLGFVPLLLALWKGWDYLSSTFDSFYTSQASYGGWLQRMHYAAFVIPVLGIIGLVVWYVLDKRRVAY